MGYSSEASQSTPTTPRTLDLFSLRHSLDGEALDTSAKSMSVQEVVSTGAPEERSLNLPLQVTSEVQALSPLGLCRSTQAF